MSISIPKLLRRTLALAGAGMLVAAGLPAAAQGTVTLSGSSGNTCTYSQMTVQPNGTIVVTCSNSNPSPTANFYVSAPGTGDPGSAGTATIGRSGGPAGALTATFTQSGACSGSGSVSLTAGQSQTVAYTLGASGVCTITIGAPSGHTASPQSASITVTAPQNPQVPGCPTPDPNTITRDLAYGPVDQLRMKSGAIASFPVIALPDLRFSSVEFTQGQQGATPGSAVTEFSVSQCRGAIITSVPDCYYKSTQGQVNSNKITIYTKTKPEWGWTSQASMSGFGCLADSSQGTWYVNVRWTYPSCVWGDGNCGFSMQWAIGAW